MATSVSYDSVKYPLVGVVCIMVNRRAEVLDALEYNRRGRTILKALQTLQKPGSSNNP